MVSFTGWFNCLKVVKPLHGSKPFLTSKFVQFLVLISLASEKGTPESTIEPTVGFEYGRLTWQSSALTFTSLLLNYYCAIVSIICLKRPNIISSATFLFDFGIIPWNACVDSNAWNVSISICTAMFGDTGHWFKHSISGRQKTFCS